MLGIVVARSFLKQLNFSQLIETRDWQMKELCKKHSVCEYSVGFLCACVRTLFDNEGKRPSSNHSDPSERAETRKGSGSENRERFLTPLAADPLAALTPLAAPENRERFLTPLAAFDSAPLGRPDPPVHGRRTDRAEPRHPRAGPDRKNRSLV